MFISKQKIEVLIEQALQKHTTDCPHFSSSEYKTCAWPGCSTVVSKNPPNLYPYSIWANLMASGRSSSAYCAFHTEKGAEKEKAERWAREHPEQAAKCMKKHQKGR